MRDAEEQLNIIAMDTGHDVMMERPEEFHALLRELIAPHVTAAAE